MFNLGLSIVNFQIITQSLKNVANNKHLQNKIPCSDPFKGSLYNVQSWQSKETPCHPPPSNKPLIRANLGTMVVNSPQQGLISWEGWHWGGPLKFPWSNVFLQPKKEKPYAQIFGHFRHFLRAEAISTAQVSWASRNSPNASWAFGHSYDQTKINIQITKHQMEIGRAPGYSIHDRESCLIIFDTLWNWSLLSPSLKGDKVNCHGIMVLKVVDVGGSVYESLSY